MNRSILTAFIADQRRAKALVADKLGVPEGVSAFEWAGRHHETCDAYDAAPFAEVFRPHGYGLELRVGDLYVDFDYSETGRADGFDEWRIFVHLVAGQFDDNGLDEQLTDRIDEWFREMTDAGHIVRRDNLYYLADPPN